MSLVEFIGFVVSLAAMIFLIIKQVLDQVKRRNHPEKYPEDDREEEHNLQDLLKTIIDDTGSPAASKPKALKSQHADNDKARSKKHPLNKPKSAGPDKYQFKSTLDDHYQKSSIENRPLKTSITDPYKSQNEKWNSNDNTRKRDRSAYDIVETSQQSHAAVVIHRLHSSKDLLIIKEIFGPPKALSRNHWDE